MDNNPLHNPSPPAIRRENQIQLQGPRPTPLRVNKDSHKIKKPPIAPKPPVPPHAPPHHQPPPANQPVIIYSVSPKPIHVDPSNFMSIVQRLTGRDSSSSSSSSMPETSYTNSGSDPPISPAARFAAIERTSPKERERRRGEREEELGELGIVDMVGEIQMPGILSPAPANLPAISPGMFLPPAEGQTLFGVSDYLMSPFMMNSGSFLPSPSALFFSASNPIASPTPSPASDLFNLFDF